MQLYMCVGKTRDAMGDNYKGLVNSLGNKENIIVIIPGCYRKDEFSDEFYAVVLEDVYLSKSPLYRLKKQLQLFRKIRMIGHDKINETFFMNPDITLFPFIMMIKNMVNKMTMWLHDPLTHDGASVKEYLKAYLFRQFVMKKMTDIVISYTDPKNELQRQFPRLSVHVLYLPEMIEQEFEDVKNTILPIEYDYIFFGRIEMYKGVDLLIKAFSNSYLLDRKLMIVGTGSFENKIKKLITTDNIKFYNRYVSNEELATMIMKSKYVILPYLSATGTQTVQLANYYGKMVVANKTGCFKEYIEQGINGYFIERNSVEGIIDTIKTIEKIPSSSNNAIIEVSKKFCIKDISKQLSKIVGGEMIK